MDCVKKSISNKMRKFTPAGIWYPLTTKFFCGILLISKPIGINLEEKYTDHYTIELKVNNV